ncbi:MAG: energy transducer TonB [Flavobacteriaceae bacterium]
MKKIIFIPFFLLLITGYSQTNDAFESVLKSFDSITIYKDRRLKISNAIDALILKDYKEFSVDTLKLNYGLFIDKTGKIYVSSNNINDDKAYEVFEVIFKSKFTIKVFKDKDTKEITNFAIYGLKKYVRNENGNYELIVPKHIINTSDEDDFIKFNIIESVPEYPGCTGNNQSLKNCMSSKISRVISKNFNIDLANNLNLKIGKHRIFVTFIIDKKGFVRNIKARAPHSFLAREAVRIIELLPPMTKPGTQRGKPVRVKYALPITFVVEENNTPVKKPKKRRSWFNRNR